MPVWLILVLIAGFCAVIGGYLVYEFAIKTKKYRPKRDSTFNAEIVYNKDGKIQDIYADKDHTMKKANVYIDGKPFYKNERVACFFIESPINGDKGKMSSSQLDAVDHWKKRYSIYTKHMLPYIKNNKTIEDNKKSKKICDDNLNEYKKEVDAFFEQIKDDPSISSIQYILGAHGSGEQEINELQGEYVEYFLNKAKETKLPIYIKNLACYQATKTCKFIAGSEPGDVKICFTDDVNGLLDGKDVKHIVKDFAKNYKDNKNKPITIYYAEHHSKQTPHYIKGVLYTNEDGKQINYHKQYYNQYIDFTGGMERLYTRSEKHKIKNKIRKLLCKDDLVKTGVNI